MGPGNIECARTQGFLGLPEGLLSLPGNGRLHLGHLPWATILLRRSWSFSLLSALKHSSPQKTFR